MYVYLRAHVPICTYCCFRPGVEFFNVDAACFFPCYCCRRRLKRRDGHGELGRGRTEKCPTVGGRVGVNVLTTINGLSTGREQAPGRLFFKKSRHLVRGSWGNSGGLVLTRWSLRTARAQHVRMAENIDETTGCSTISNPNRWSSKRI